MSGPARNPDQINTIGIVVVGICGAVLVYVTIVALQAFYMNDTSEIQMMADYGGNDVTARSVRTSQINNINEYGANAGSAGQPPVSYRIPITEAMKQVVVSAKADPSTLVPTQGRSDKATVKPIFGRPQPVAAPVDPGAGSAVAPGADAGSAAAPGTGSAGAPGSAPSAPMTPTGGQGAGGGPVAPTTGGSTTPAPAGTAAKGDAPPQ